MKHPRRTFLKTATAGLAMAGLSSFAAERKANILLVMADQFRGMDLGHAGNAQVKTPNLDRLAREGLFFYNAVANSPLCTPSRAILLTGKYPRSNRAISNDLPLPTGQETLATVLYRQGYRTGNIGKWHLDGVPRSKFTPPGPSRHGFNTFWAAYNCHHNYFKTKYYLDTPELIQKDGYEPDIQTDLAIEFIQKYKNDPFCLVVSWGPPHAPYQLVPDEYREKVDPEALILRRNCINAKRRVIADYYAAITALDTNMGRLTAALERLGMRDRTIVVFTSDHGDMLWSQGRVKKQQPWEESIRVPLILSAPGCLPSGVRSDLLFGTADLTPTLLGLLEVPVPHEMQGLNLSARLLADKGEEHHSLLIMDILPADQARQWNGRPWRGVRTKRYTYARYQDKGWVLYDNKNDPYQLVNLIDDPSSKKLREEMEKELQHWLNKLNDRFLTGEGHLEELGLTGTWRQRQEHFRSGKNW